MFDHKMRTMIVFQGLMILLCIQQGTSQECAANGDCDSHERWYVSFLFSFQFQTLKLTILTFFILNLAAHGEMKGNGMYNAVRV